MALLRGICHLLHAEGYTIKGVQKILREQGVDTVKRVGAGPVVEAPAEPVTPATVAKRTGKKGAATATAARGMPSKAEVRERLLAAIAELESCRGILLGKPPEAAARSAPQKARRSARA
jgi:hypothetical protein